MQKQLTYAFEMAQYEKDKYQKLVEKEQSCKSLKEPAGLITFTPIVNLQEVH